MRRIGEKGERQLVCIYLCYVIKIDHPISLLRATSIHEVYEIQKRYKNIFLSNSI